MTSCGGHKMVLVRYACSQLPEALDNMINVSSDPNAALGRRL